MVLYIPGNAKASQVLEGVKYSAGTTQYGTGTMKNMGDQEMTAVGAYMQEGYLSLSMGGIGDGKFQAVNDGTQLTYADPVHVSAKNVIMGVEMLGLDGTATSDANATAADIRAGVIAYSQGQKLVGTSVSPKYTKGETRPYAAGSYSKISVTGTGFKPKYVIAYSSAPAADKICTICEMYPGRMVNTMQNGSGAAMSSTKQGTGDGYFQLLDNGFDMCVGFNGGFVSGIVTYECWG
ncbi:hypothetical protein NYE25_06355 [Paenibacillus sp. FSL E2-8871]|uniref:hypothetical protein n=1 Tax=Paenibacillus sp. FSL E2-8871 TaxID=2975326 RepID=UPI0030F7BCAB